MSASSSRRGVTQAVRVHLEGQLRPSCLFKGALSDRLIFSLLSGDESTEALWTRSLRSSDARRAESQVFVKCLVKPPGNA